MGAILLRSIQCPNKRKIKLNVFLKVKVTLKT